jgi:hypothetical protein
MATDKTMFNEVAVEAEAAAKAAKRINGYIDRADKAVPSYPRIQDGILVTVSVEWLAWMIAFFEGEAEGPEF